MPDNSVNITMNFIANTAVFSNINQRLDVVSSHVNNVSNQFAQVSNRVNNVTNNVNHLGDRMGRLRSASSGIGGILSKIGAIGMGAAGVITTISAITGKMKEFAEANRAQQEAEAKLAQVMRNTMGASAALIATLAHRSDIIPASRIEGLPDGLDVEAQTQTLSSIHQRLLAIEQTYRQAKMPQKHKK